MPASIDIVVVPVKSIAVADSREPSINMIGWLFLCCNLLPQGVAGFGARYRTFCRNFWRSPLYTADEIIDANL